MKRISLLISAVILLIGCATALNAASSLYAISGLVETPDDSFVSARALTPSAAFVSGVKEMHASDGWDLATFGAAFSILPNLEVSASVINPEPSGWDSEVFVNAKYRLLAESVDKPSVTVGIVDAAGRIEDFTDGAIDDPSLFVVVGKNISSMAEGVSGNVSKPIRGTLGIGTGLYKGIFAGLDMALAPKLDVAVEYLGTGIRNKTTFSGCVRYQPTQALSIQAGALGFESFYAGLSFNLSTY